MRGFLFLFSKFLITFLKIIKKAQKNLTTVVFFYILGTLK